MPLATTRALVLQAFRYGDTSKILRLLTPDLGVRSVIAKGALRPRSRFGGVLEPFTEGDAQFFLKEGRDLHTLSGFDLVRSRQGIGRSLGAFAGASLIAEIVLRSATEEPHPLLFHTVSASLDALAAPGGDASVGLAGTWRVVSLLGYRPELDDCMGCGRTLSPQEPTRFDVQAGGVACTACRPAGRILDPSTRAAVRRMAEGDAAGDVPGDLALHRALLRAFLGAHLSHDHPLRSLEVFGEELR